MAPTPIPPSWSIPKLNLRIEDLSHEGVDIFLSAVNPKAALQEAVVASFTWLYTAEKAPTNVKQIVLVLRPMDGVAHTLGSKTHKEIHFSLDHIRNSQKRAREEIMGILVHEVVHCYQFDAKGTCPGGLVEGIADYVRLKDGRDPPHWTRKPGETWDAGYEKTAFFLDWLEDRYGEGTIRELNGLLDDRKYHRRIFKEVTGRPIRKLWAIYCEEFARKAPELVFPGSLKQAS